MEDRVLEFSVFCIESIADRLRIIEAFAKSVNIQTDQALDFFYKSRLYQEMSHGISDMHCRSDHYLTEELEHEWTERP